MFSPSIAGRPLRCDKLYFVTVAFSLLQLWSDLSMLQLWSGLIKLCCLLSHQSVLFAAADCSRGRYLKREYSALKPFVIISLSYLLFTTTDGAVR